MSSKLTQSEFIERSIKVHGNKYNYSNINYVGIFNKISIICPIHGNFLQCPHNHLNGNGCKKCCCESNIILQKKSSSQFILDSQNIHKDKYNYYKVDYNGSAVKVIIICKIHGEFLQHPYKHLSGQGCAKCNGSFKSTTNEFICKAKEIHNDRYDYSKTVYKNNNSKLIIICKTHGEFNQHSGSHLKGSGCPKCKNIISKNEIKFLNYIKLPDTKETRQVNILRKKVDGYDPKTNTIYEFLGDYWHGNPCKFDSSDMNRVCKKSFGKLYEETFLKFNVLKSIGYNVKYIWETDWEKFLQRKCNVPKIMEFNI